MTLPSDPPPPLPALRELLAAATPGPWRECCADRAHACQTGLIWGPDGNTGICEGASSSIHGGAFDARPTPERIQANTRLIVAAVNALPKLIEVAEQAQDVDTLCHGGSVKDAQGRTVDIHSSLFNLRAALRSLAAQEKP